MIIPKCVTGIKYQLKYILDYYSLKYAMLLGINYPKFQNYVEDRGIVLSPLWERLVTQENIPLEEVAKEFGGNDISEFFDYYYFLKDLEVKTILEIGGGLGILAKIFKIFSQVDYTMVDFQKCLDIAKKYLSGIKVNYIPIGTEIKGQYDLIINIGSLQEMTIRARDYWMEFIDGHCDYFYSYNYGVPSLGFGTSCGIQPLNIDWSKWQVVKQQFRIVDNRVWREILIRRKKY